MFKKLSFVFLLALSTTVFADEDIQYNQKTLPNGDVETTYTSSDGTKMVSVQHKDGSVETHVSQTANEKKDQ